MERPLWIDRHAPALEALPQSDAAERLKDAVDDPVNLVVFGPPGVGKTAATRALAEATHEDPDSDLIEINVADFFDRTKKEIRTDPRFAGFLQGETEFSKQYRHGSKQNKYKKDLSKAAMISHVLKESASYPPASGSFNTILLDNAEAIREDFQQALRRIMEQYYEATQFVFATRQPSKLIAPIRSRCVQIPMKAPGDEETAEVLATIAEREDVAFDEEGLGYIASYAEGNLREAILAAQTVAETQGSIEGAAVLEPLREVGQDDRIEAMLEAAEEGAFTDARSILDDLLIEEGRSGEEVLEEIMDLARTRYTGDRLAALHERAGEIEFDLTRGTSERIHLGHLLATLQS